MLPSPSTSGVLCTTDLPRLHWFQSPQLALLPRLWQRNLCCLLRCQKSLQFCTTYSTTAEAIRYRSRSISSQVDWKLPNQERTIYSYSFSNIKGSLYWRLVGPICWGEHCSRICIHTDIQTRSRAYLPLRQPRQLPWSSVQPAICLNTQHSPYHVHAMTSLFAE